MTNATGSTRIQLLNETRFDLFTIPGDERQAIDAVNDFTRTKMREIGFYRRVLPPLQIYDAKLDRLVDTQLPVTHLNGAPRHRVQLQHATPG